MPTLRSRCRMAALCLAGVFASALALTGPSPAHATVGDITTFADPAGIASTDAPQEITRGPDGNLWYANFSNSRIGRVSNGLTCDGQAITADLRFGGKATAGNDVGRHGLRL